jgi:capsular polysaccharide transport system permease protein
VTGIADQNLISLERPAPYEPGHAPTRHDPAAPKQADAQKKPQARRQSAPKSPPDHAPPPATKGRLRPQKQRRRLLSLSFLVFALIPTIAAGAYYALWAANQYAVEVRFAVRGLETSPAPDILGAFTGVSGSGSTTTDSYILMDYIHSVELVRLLENRFALRRMFAHPDADPVAAFGRTDAPIEEFAKYWQSMVGISYDNSSNIVAVEVRSFSPDDSVTIAKAVLEESEKLINKLSERARLDAVASAQAEVTRAEERLRRSQRELRNFRERQQDIDPSLTAQANLQRLSALQSQINEARTKLASQRTFMAETAPPIVYTKSQIKALEEQLAAERAKFGQAGATSTGTTLSGVVEDYQSLQMEQEFAQKAYLSALSSLERARIAADQQQRYLATFLPPRKPQSAIYPKRVLNTLVIALIALVLWAIGVLVFYAIRDHAG